MNKRKIVLMAAALCMVAILGFGGTLAYLTDFDRADNVFTVGNVHIDLQEEFNPEEAHLIPGVYDPETKKYENAINKDVAVALKAGSDDAYVRVHIAVPQLLDEPANATYNVLHFNYEKESVVAGEWCWYDTLKQPGTDTDNSNNTKWNIYEETIDGIAYNVYVVTYVTKLSHEDGPAKTRTNAMSQVYLDPKTTNEKIAELKETLKDDWHIYVIAEAAQADGFDDAYHALNTSFGIPGTYDVQWVPAAE